MTRRLTYSPGIPKAQAVAKMPQSHHPGLHFTGEMV
jgi:hypothetical protein